MRLILPTLRGKMGDWFYYVTLLSFKEIAKRVSLTDEIHKDKGLSKMIQRKVSKRTKDIVEYLNTQDQRFFNSLILGIYGGKPQWQEIDIVENIDDFSEKELDYLNRSFGVLSLSGEEKIFAIDGQHRSKAIKDCLEKSNKLENEEVSVIFVAHNTTEEGVIRTRRLFSTLNRYAKPVSLSEIIALDEEDNCAIITRNIVEYFDLLKGKILFNQNRSISPNNKTAFTNIIVLYDIVKLLLTNSPIFGVRVSGENKNVFIKKRTSDDIIKQKQDFVQEIFVDLFIKISVLKDFTKTGVIDRTDKNSSLLFKPIGQNILFSVLKISMENGLKENAIEFFNTNDFSLTNDIWNKIFIDTETGTIKTDKYLQKYTTQLMLKKLGIVVKQTDKDKKVHENFGIDINEI
ncbi:MAG: DGQHR domain-containing protein [Bacteroidales bacterium]|nr:DGQHR domain-containing protein [Bacteroidales bacterium]